MSFAATSAPSSPVIRPNTLAWTARTVAPAPVAPVPVAVAAPPLPVAGALEFRQLRHHSKNALQRLLCEVAKVADGQADWRQKRIFSELERRLMLSARLSDALFGFTSAPGPLDRRLLEMTEATVGLLGDTDQSIGTTVRVQGAVPDAQQNAVLRIAHEMIGNAVKHGLRARMVGRIELLVVAESQGTAVLVRDDGWGPPCAVVEEGSGMAIMHELTGEDGDVALSRDGDWTVASAELPARISKRGGRSLGLMTVWPVLALLPVAAILTSWCYGVL